MTAYQPTRAPSTGEEVGAGRPAPATLGRYELLGKLATGGMGEIHLARLAGDGGFEKVVVIKRLLPELVASEQFVAMFLDEARIAARLSHPNVCEVFELGRDGAEYWLAMPYLEGVSVAELIARPRDHDRRRALRFVAGVIAQAAEGLHHAHELRGGDGEPLGLVHRDVSPSNLMVTTAGAVKVLDFGIAKVRGATARTELGTIKGKYAYMSPEQVRGDALDRRSDVFALGVVLFELATHQRLFKRPSDFLAAKAILEEPIPRADAVDPAVPAGLADVIERALAQEPGARYATARELGAAVVAAAAAIGGAMTAAEIAEVLATEHATELGEQRTRQERVLARHRGGALTTAPTRALRPRPRRRARFLVPALALALAGTVAALALLLSRPDPGHSSRADAAPEVVYADAAGTGDGPVSEVGQGGGPVSEVGQGGGPVSEVGQGGGPVSEVGQGGGPVSEVGRGAGGPVSEVGRGAGFVSIDSDPWATIYVDGERIGVTPLIRVRVPAGRRRIRAVRESGEEQRVTVEVKAGRLAAPVKLRW